jgi:hypothetical protein
VNIGPFEQIYRMLVSTGTTDYNDGGATGSDTYPVECGFAVPSILVNKSSFTDYAANLNSGYPNLAIRKFNMLREPIGFGELVKRECVLLGLALVWSNGKIALRPLAHPEWQDAQVTLDDSSNSASDDAPVVLMNTDNVLNSFVLKAGYDWASDKYNTITTINDRESIDGVGFIKKRELEHPGISAYVTKEQLQDELTRMMIDQKRIFSFPLQVVRWTLNATYYNRVFAGDLVTFAPASKYPNPFGDGKYSTTSVFATVMDVAWSLDDKERGLHGTCTLLVHSRVSGTRAPWAPAAVVDISQNGGSYTSGWDSGNKRLWLLALEYGATGDTDDGAAFSSGDEILIQARAPADPTSLAASEGPFSATVASAYETDGAEILTLTTDPFGGSFDSDTEYFITVANYTAEIFAQIGSDRASWQANSNTHLLNAVDAAMLWS